MSAHDMSSDEEYRAALERVERAVGVQSSAPVPASAALVLVKSSRDNRDTRDTAFHKSRRRFRRPGHARDKGVPFPHYELVEDGPKPGVYWCGVAREQDGSFIQRDPEWVCSPMHVVAMTRDPRNGDWGRLVKFADDDGHIHQWICPQSWHARDGAEAREALLDAGLRITDDPKLRRRVTDYVQQATPKARVRCVTRTGWHGKVFVLPRGTIGDAGDEQVMFQSSTTDESGLGQSGTLAGWIANVSQRCTGNSRLVMGISTGFAAPCVDLLGLEGSGVHLRGRSSTGKSTVLAVAGSLFGPWEYVRNWRSTDNGLEGTAAMLSGMLFILDEMGQIEPRFAGSAAYLIANGRGKARSKRDGSPRAVRRWKVLLLSSGEIGLRDLIAETGRKIRAGQEVRIIDLPSDAGFGLGVFEHVPAGMTAAAFSDHLKQTAANDYGHAFPAFVEKLAEDLEAARRALRELQQGFAQELTPAGASGEVRRVADRFALIAAAGELATGFGLTGWDEGESRRAIGTCFAAWLEARGTAGDAERVAVLAQVRGFLEAHGEARFTNWYSTDVDRVRTFSRAGFRKDSPGEGPTYYVEREAFRAEVCSGFDYRMVVHALVETGALRTGGDREYTRKERLPDGRNARVYVITPALWNDE